MTDGQANEWWTRNAGRVLIGLYLGATGVVIWLSADRVPDAVKIPLYVYLYAGLGALAYIFTSLLTEFKKPTVDLIKVGLRIPAALLLSAAIYLLISFFVEKPSEAIVAGISFLTGLFVKVALNALGGLAKRLLGPGGEQAGQ